MGVQAIQDSVVAAIAPKVREHEPREKADRPQPPQADRKASEPVSPLIVKPPEVNGANVSLQFSVNIRTGEKLLKIIDTESGKLIRQVPPEELLHIMETLQTLKGVLLSTKS